MSQVTLAGCRTWLSFSFAFALALGVFRLALALSFGRLATTRLALAFVLVIAT